MGRKTIPHIVNNSVNVNNYVQPFTSTIDSNYVQPLTTDIERYASQTYWPMFFKDVIHMTSSIY